MLILTRQRGQRVFLGDFGSVRVEEIARDHVKLYCVAAPMGMNSTFTVKLPWQSEQKVGAVNVIALGLGRTDASQVRLGFEAPREIQIARDDVRTRPNQHVQEPR